MKRIILMSSLSCVFPTMTHACINTYAYELSPNFFESKTERDQFYKDQLQDFLVDYPRKPSLEQQNDYAVQLIYNGRYAEAIQILSHIEKIKPNLVNTAVNIGTAYELDGKLDQAHYWIQEGIKRDHNIHKGSEWIHLNIIEAKQNHTDKTWTAKHPILGYHYGNGYFPVAYRDKVKATSDEIENVIGQASLQLLERRKFVFQKDPIMAQVYFELANLETARADSWYERMILNRESNVLMQFSEEYGLEKNEITERRKTLFDTHSYFKRMYYALIDKVWFSWRDA